MKAFLLFVTILLFLSSLAAQSAGSMTLLAIESKANAIEVNDQKIAELNTNRMKSFSEEEDHARKLRKELNDLDYEMMLALKELREGLFCSDCGRSKSEVERQDGGTFDDHIRAGASGGRHKVPASPEKIQEKTQEYENKIAAKREELRKFEFEENEFSRKRKEWDKQMADLANRNVNMRQEVFELSKHYSQVIMEDARRTFEDWSSILTQIIAEKHYIEDRIDILTVNLQDLDKAERDALSEVKDKVRKKVSDEQARIKDKIHDNILKLDNLRLSYNQARSPLEAELEKIGRRLQKIEDKLRYEKSLTTEEREDLEKEKEGLISKRLVLQKSLAEKEQQYKEQKTAIEQENKELDDKHWILSTNLYKMQNEAAKLVEEAFDIKRSILNDAKTARLARLKAVGELFLAKLSFYLGESKELMQLVLIERQRFVNACIKATCQCVGYDTYLQVYNLWGKYESCAKSIADRNFLVYDCDLAIADYKQQYASWLNGISDADLAALQRKVTSTRFNTILKIISQ